MKNITGILTQQYLPIKAIVLYKGEGSSEDHYIESFDFDDNGQMINAHPLSRQEMSVIGNSMLTGDKQDAQYLESQSLFDPSILFLKPGENGFVLWHTPPQHRQLQFVDSIGLQNGRYPVPALLWKAGKDSLDIYALKETGRPAMNTTLYKAPFFNIHENGNVCMGNVNIELEDDDNLAGMMKKWDQYFFNSRFSHLLISEAPVKGNIIQLYKSLLGSRKIFPVTKLIKHSRTIKTLLNG